MNPAVFGYQPNPAFSGPAQGDPAAAKKLLEQAGVKLPYPITFTYPTTDTRDKQAAALKETWDAAGFDTTLDGLGDTYYDVIQKPDKASDVIWAGWGADWPSAITVTPPLFDSRPNLTSNSDGQDYGAYKSDKFNALVDQAQSATSLSDQTTALQEADKVLGQDTAYVPIEVQKFYFLYGSKVPTTSTPRRRPATRTSVRSRSRTDRPVVPSTPTSGGRLGGRPTLTSDRGGATPRCTRAVRR